MKTHAKPVDSERKFLLNEAFFSCTDRRGIILAGNEIFQRISGYSESELIGAPHNIIRHPDTPRAVFKLLWATIQAGQPIAALVKNMAKDGTYYWVLALVAPTPGGYISIRFKPTSPLFRATAAIYDRMRALEIECESRGESGEAAMAASTALLGAELRKLGFADYEAFTREALLRTEIDSRDKLLLDSGLSLLPSLPDGCSARPIGLEAVYQDSCTGGRRELAAIHLHYDKMGGFLELEKQLRQSAKSARSLAQEFSLTSINISIRAMHCGDKGGGISVVAGNLSDTAREITQTVTVVDEKAARIASVIGVALFAIAWARLQIETAVMYYHEIYRDYLRGELEPGTPKFDARLLLLEALAAAAQDAHVATDTALKTMIRELLSMGEDAQAFRRHIITLQVSKVVGLTEAAHLSGVDEIQASFDDMRSLVERIQGEFKAMEDIIDNIMNHARNAPEILASLAISMDLLKANAARMRDGAREDEGRPAISGALSAGGKTDAEPAFLAGV